MAERLELLIELIDQRDAGGDVQTDDVVVRHLVQVLDQGAQTIAVGRDDHFLATLDRGHDRLMPVGEEPRDRILETFGQGNLRWAQPAVARVGAGIARV
jgi:hypothetical protein